MLDKNHFVEKLNNIYLKVLFHASIYTSLYPEIYLDGINQYNLFQSQSNN